ncbi:MAG TPA: PEGA domain-containing protein [bacterium]|nr:PEGA domain-containing protein [bacterium]
MEGALGVREDPMNHLDNDWTENSFWDQWRMVLIFGFVILVMGVVGALLVGPDGILRMFGLVDDAYKATLTVSITPDNAMLQLDFTPEENPLTRTVDWDRSTEHVIEVQHPAYRPEKLVLSVPESPDALPVWRGGSTSTQINITQDRIDVRITMIPEYIPVRIQTRPTGASVTIDGIETGKTTPMTHEFKTDETARIAFTRSGYETLEVSYDVPSESPESPVVFELKGKPTPRTLQGRLVIESEYPVDVYSGRERIIAGKRSATATLKEGKHSIRIRNDSYLLDDTRQIRIRDGRTEKITLDPPGKMIVDTNPPGAAVFVGETELGTAPGTFSVAPGLYNVVFQWAECDETHSEWVKIVPGQTRRVPRVNGCR